MEGLDLASFPVLRDSQKWTVTEGCIVGGRGNLAAGLKVTIHQFAVVLAFATPLWKLQGRTLVELVVSFTGIILPGK